MRLSLNHMASFVDDILYVLIVILLMIIYHRVLIVGQNKKRFNGYKNI